MIKFTIVIVTSRAIIVIIAHIFIEFLSVSLARTLYPEMIVAQFGDYRYEYV
jgi:hypothetical protein